MPPLLFTASTAFGLAASAGLNTSLTLLLVGLLARFGLLSLAPPYDLLGSNLALAALVLLAVLEALGDKMPGVDTVVHVLQWPLAALAGAILFASQTTAIAESASALGAMASPIAPGQNVMAFSSQTFATSGLAPGLAILIGLLTAGTVHGARMAARPIVTGLTLGVGNTAISLAEDGYALILASTSIFIPVVGLFLLVVLLLIVGAVGLRAIESSRRLSRWLRGR